MSLFNWIRLILAIPIGLVLIGLAAVLIEDIKYKK